MKENKSYLIAYLLAALLIGGIATYVIFPREVEKQVVEVKYLPAQNCVAVACTPVACKPVKCTPVKCLKDEDSDTYDLNDAELKDFVSNQKNVSYVGILRNSRTCEKFIINEQNKGFIAESVTDAPYCWLKDGRQNRTIIYDDTYEDGCRMAYKLGC